MSAPEIKLECLKLAVPLAIRESPNNLLLRVAEMTNQFYTLVTQDPIPEPLVEPELRSTRKKADKAAEFLT